MQNGLDIATSRRNGFLKSEECSTNEISHTYTILCLENRKISDIKKGHKPILNPHGITVFFMSLFLPYVFKKI